MKKTKMISKKYQKSNDGSEIYNFVYSKELSISVIQASFYNEPLLSIV